MKYNLFTYSLLAAFCAAAPLQAAPADAAKVKAEAEAKKKAEAEARAKKKAEEEARKKQQAEAKARMAELNALVKDMDKKRVYFAKRIDTLLALLERPEMQADRAIRFRVYQLALQYTSPPGWTRIQYFSYDTVHEVLPRVTKLVLDDPSFTEEEKFYTAVTRLVQYACDRQKWDEAEKWARFGMAYEKLSPNAKADANLQLAKIYRYQFRYDDAMKVVKEAYPLSPLKVTTYASNLAYEFGKPDDAMAYWKMLNNEYEELIYFASKKRAAYVDRALAFLKDEKNSTGKRWSVFCNYFMGSLSAQADEARKLTAELPVTLKINTSWANNRSFSRPYQQGDYLLTATVCEYLAAAPIRKNYNFQCVYVISLGAIGKKAEAAKLAAEFALTDKHTPAQKTRLLAYEAILLGKDAEAVISAAKLSRKDEAAVYLSLARQALGAWNMTELAEKYVSKYQSYFAKPVERRIEVKFFDTPIKNIAAWRKVYPQLDKQYCDIPYKGSMDFLETDVSTGDRGVVKAEDGAKLEGMMELTALCDRDGVHLFLRTSDSNARAIEQGFARGIGTEMYFAPGRNQPYVCMGSDPVKGVTFMFQTTYNNRNATRPERVTNPTTSFRSEVEFTDTDYVLHLFFAWDLYYNKLPAPGTDWRFDCLAWSKAGGFSWGGSQGIHAASEWGNLRFNLTEKQLNAIRKGIIFRTYRSYKMARFEPGVSENLFLLWADDYIGDPVFYKEYLAPLQAELDAYAKRVKYDMSDDEVAEIYTKALPRWKGLAHEIDHLRRIYLQKRLMDGGGK